MSRIDKGKGWHNIETECRIDNAGIAQPEWTDD